jgi:hypothetical protein
MAFITNLIILFFSLIFLAMSLLGLQRPRK